MKKLIWITLLFAFTTSFAQTIHPAEEASIKQVINDFFESLEKQDTSLYRSTMDKEAQIWRLNNTKSPANLNMRLSKDDIGGLVSESQWKETAISFDIKIHKGMAVAWVPYTFKLNGEFSHCGVDIFTLMKTDDKWKIVSTAYTVDREGCEELK